MHSDRLVTSAVKLAVLSWALSGTLAAQGQAFEVSDTLACPGGAYVLDMEFDHGSRTMAFIDQLQNLKVIRLSREGLSPNPACTGTVIDTGALVTVFDAGLVNGPEWGRSQRGAEIFYTKSGVDGLPALARAWKEGDVWRTEYLANGSSRGVPVGSLNSSDDVPRIMYVANPSPDTYATLWREADDPSTETWFPGAANRVTASGPRWVLGKRAITTSVQDANGVYQAALHDIDTKTTELLTSGPGNKGEVWMWRAPEFGGDFVFSTVVDNCCLKIYRQLAGTWTEILSRDAGSFASESGIFSPEPYVHAGRSYVLMLTSPVGRRLGRAHIWITAIDPAQPLLRQVTPQGVEAVRFEPEWVSTPTGLFVFYTQYDSLRRPSLRRAATGL